MKLDLNIFFDLIVFSCIQSLDIVFIFCNIFFLLIYSYYRKWSSNFFLISTYFIKSIFFLCIYIFLKIFLLNFYFPLSMYLPDDPWMRSLPKSVNKLSYFLSGNTFSTYFSGVHCSSLYSMQMQILLSIVGLVSLVYFYLFFYFNKKINIQVIHVFFFSTIIYLLLWVMPFQNLFFIFFAFETLTYLLIGLVALNPNKYSSEALTKFFIISSISGVLTLFGMLQFFILTGNLNLVSLYQFIAIFGSNDANFIGFFVFLILFSIISKLGVLPISWYIFDLYQVSVLPVVFLLAVVLKLGVFFFINLFFLFLDFYFSEMLYFILLLLSIFSSVAGCLLTIKEYNLNRFFSTNSVMSSGFLLATLYYSNNPYNLNIAGFQYLLAYVINMTLLFYILIKLIKFEGISSQFFFISNINDFKGFSKTCLFTSIILTIVFFSFIGIPPLLGFVGKFAILWTLLFYKKFFIFFIFILISIISSFFYLRILQFVWFYNFNHNSIFFRYIATYNFLKVKKLLFLSNSFLKIRDLFFYILLLYLYIIFLVSLFFNLFYIIYYTYYFYEIHKIFSTLSMDLNNVGWYSTFFSNKDSI